MLSSNENANMPDWEITPDGLYIATRHFLIRRGYCCANQCRHCPYINWRYDAAWIPAPAEAIQAARVSPKAIEGAKRLLAFYEERVTKDGEEQGLDARMIVHYRLLLERWAAL